MCKSYICAPVFLRPHLALPTDVFHYEPDYLENEKAYEAIRDEILGEGEESGGSDSVEEGSDTSEESDEGGWACGQRY